MSSRIKILPESLTNKIAAGEVVERPASTVKELVENALDAGASEIVVEIEGGGKRLIKVSDTGCGMSREDALLALERHATSKIATEDNLMEISTLGFRGEALPSIAAVSRFVLATREKGSQEGVEIYVEGGRIRDVKGRGMAEGTIIEVRNLFFNTPARLKFLKSNETEAGHVADHLVRLALSRPDVRFTFVSDGRVVFRALNGDLEERVVSVLGRSIAPDLCRVVHQDAGLTLTGLAGKPDCSRAAASHVYTYVNGRFVRDKVFQHAILQVYRRFMERGRYPVAILFLTLPTGEVDVNVHPTKHEVRFREQTRVHDFIVAALEKIFRNNPWARKHSGVAVAVSCFEAPVTSTREKAVEIREAAAPYRSVNRPLEPVELPLRCEGGPAFLGKTHEHGNTQEVTGYFATLKVIGQFAGEYLLCQDEDDLVIIDQHAAHERIAFERLKREFAGGEIESQGLLFPQVVDFSHSESLVVREHLSVLHMLGFQLEEFGGASLVVKAVPRMLSHVEFLKILMDIIEELSSLGKSHTLIDIQEGLLMRIACHSVLRGCTLLTLPEISSLLAALDSAGYANTCPHGRPVYRKLTRMDLAKMFKRV